jgi:enoyl-CoA hydratase
MAVGELVRLEVDADNQVGTIRLERPPMNALSQQVIQELGECAVEAAAHDDVGAVVVWGGPKVFAAGADIKEFPEWDYQSINGYALGGGCELALSCDFRFAADNAKLGQPEILLGIIPGAGGTQRLPRLVGPSKAKELIFSGRMVDMVEAPQIGLVDAVFPADDVYDAAVEQAAKYAAGPYAIRLAKRAIDDGMESTLDHGLRLEASLFAESFTTEDAEHGIASFIENGPGKATFHRR